MTTPFELEEDQFPVSPVLNNGGEANFSSAISKIAEMKNSTQDIIDAFRDAMASQGITFDGPLEADGKFHRIVGHGDKKNRRNTWYILHLDGKPSGAFGSLRLYGDEKFKWTATGTVALTPEERAELRARIKRQQAEKEAAEVQRHERAAIAANKMWEAAAPATAGHPYLKRKKIDPFELRVGVWVKKFAPDPETGEVQERRILNALLIPIRDRKKKIVSLQAIFDEPKKISGEMRDKDFIYGGRKRGCWATIGKPKPVEGVVTVVICEGYATGASIHMATGFPIVVAFDTGNLKPVAEIVRKIMPAAQIVIAGDNDQFTTSPVNNPGMKYAKDAAKAVRGIVVCPEFVSLDGRPSDFNDLYVRQGDEEVYNQVSLAIKPLGDAPKISNSSVRRDIADLPATQSDASISAAYFTVLGHYDEKWFIYNHRMKQIVSRPMDSFSDSTMMMIAPLQWWEMNFSAKNGVDKKAANNWLLNISMERGIFNPSMRRGRGAWWDNGRTIFHFGDRLMVDGDMMDVTKIESEFVYEQAIKLRVPDAEAMSDEDGKRLYDIASKFRWVRPGSALLMLGFCALAPLCGALEWRPHIWLTGGSGTGKTTILTKFIYFLMNGTSHLFQGNSTEAGIRQTLKSDARPVLFDESEQNNERERMRLQNTISMVRQASSDSDAITAKGTAGGTAMHFHIRSMFCLSSVSVNLEHEADRNRMSVLAIRPKHEAREGDTDWETLSGLIAELKADESLPARLMRRSLNLLPITLKNIKTFSRVANEVFGTERNGDQYGTLMAGAWSVVSQREATLDEARALFARYDWSDFKEQTDTDEAIKALHALLGAIVRGQNGIQLSIYELVAAASNVPQEGFEMDAKTAGALLRRNGLIVKFEGPRIENGVLMLANMSSELPKLVAGTPYATDLLGQIARVKGAFRATTQSFNGLKSRALGVPLSLIFEQSEHRAPVYDELDEETLPF